MNKLKELSDMIEQKLLQTDRHKQTYLKGKQKFTVDKKNRNLLTGLKINPQYTAPYQSLILRNILSLICSIHN